MSTGSETIAAIATPPGRGGIGVIRISGPLCQSLIPTLLHRDALKPRYAELCRFHLNSQNEPEVIDHGIALFFPGPGSFTGEDVLELQGHGSPMVLDMLLQEITRHGVRIARPGEFSERAFLNNKLDLAQAEAIADLIDSGSRLAARSAMRSLSGDFSQQVEQLTAALIQLRLYVEAAIDFPEEEIDFLSDDRIANGVENLLQSLATLRRSAQRGRLLQEGMTVAIAGRPNAGKSSLLNALAGQDTAIVTALAGTTRDILKEYIQLDGLPLHIIDTAGLRDSDDEVEQEGIRRARAEIDRADRILLVIDSSEPLPAWNTLRDTVGLADWDRVSLVLNKTDLRQVDSELALDAPAPLIPVSAKTGQGMDALRNHLKNCAGYGNSDSNEYQFTARLRHLTALDNALAAITLGQQHLQTTRSGELLAEELRLAQQHLSEITGEFTSDDLLGHIFSSFCIGK